MESCQIPDNPDVAGNWFLVLPYSIDELLYGGIGVRFSIYFQALFAIGSAAVRFYHLEPYDDRAREEFIKSTFNGSVRMIFTGLAVAISGVIQATTYGLSVYHVLLLLDLCWVVIIGALVPFFLIVLGKWSKEAGEANLTYSYSTKCGLYGLCKLNPDVKFASRLHLLHSLHFTITSCIGIWTFSRLSLFDSSPDNCTPSTIAVTIGYERLVTNHPYRIFSLVLYVIFALPLVNVFFAQLVLLYVPVVSLGLLAEWSKALGLIKYDDNIIISFLFPATLSAPLVAIILVIVSTEQTIKANNVTLGEAEWTLGQTLALMAAFISTIDFDLWAWRTLARKAGWNWGESVTMEKLEAMSVNERCRVYRTALESEAAAKMEEEIGKQVRELRDRPPAEMNQEAMRAWEAHCKRRGTRVPTE